MLVKHDNKAQTGPNTGEDTRNDNVWWIEKYKNK
jgi:hypothetical protein